MNRQKIVLFDIDYTLFDTTYFDSHFHKEVARLLDVDEALVKLRSGEIITRIVQREEYFAIDVYVSLLVSSLGKDNYKAKVEKLLFEQTFFRGGFYKEVPKALEKLGKIARIGIFSQGDAKLQGAKVSQSGVKCYFDEEITYIIRPKKLAFLPELAKKHKDDLLFFVDDKPTVLHEIKHVLPDAVTVWIKRGKYTREAEAIPDFLPGYTITSLNSVFSLVKKTN